MKSEGNSRVLRWPPSQCFLSQFNSIMEIKLYISDADYASLLNGTRRLRGSIGLLSPTEGTFSLHAKTGRTTRDYRKLPHGRVSMSSENLRLTLSVDFDEHGIHPAQVLIDESITASQYANGMHIDNLLNLIER